MPAHNGFLGADVDQLRAFAAACDHAGLEVNAVRARVSTALNQLAWRGRDADAARAEWFGEHARVLMFATELLDGVAYLVSRQADQQEAASGDAPGGSGQQAPGAGADRGGSATGGPADPPGSLIGDLYRRWEETWGPVDALIAVAPWVGAATTWTDAAKDTWLDWVRHADQWERANIGGWTGNALTGLSLVGAGVNASRYVDAISRGDTTGAVGEAAGFGLTFASLSSIAALRATGGVGAAAQGGWMVGSAIYDHTGHTRPMIWVGNNIIGPTGDVITGIWDDDARGRVSERWDRYTSSIGNWWRGNGSQGGGGR
ncbi:hypothetical protein G1H11_18670 [Phytoactinopolyspora alkaliphila]|uniref:WXG100 family type VII secretion target n=1 Tax=Phytoactinopolyspora alkaliphila TaxID=1783498 RepID=A0A6N9YQS3_9ACTN|nr:hypothetical protein [Phytoactinopolyspora alkaliphila]NED97324.1 hypothetical protein [Phytoactinopolyspora alkaliphila]